MAITRVIPQLRTTNMASSIRLYTEKLGFSVAFKYEDFYTGIRAGSQLIHLKFVDAKDLSISYVDEGGVEGVPEVVARRRRSGSPLIAPKDFTVAGGPSLQS
jgi:catechol 2,3-dioxygenase-like lactoylglutathione lyase family enzyme